MNKKASNPKPPDISKKPIPPPAPPRPACIDASDENLDDGFYCKLCGMSWYNCLCCHDDD